MSALLAVTRGTHRVTQNPVELEEGQPLEDRPFPHAESVGGSIPGENHAQGRVTEDQREILSSGRHPRLERGRELPRAWQNAPCSLKDVEPLGHSPREA